MEIFIHLAFTLLFLFFLSVVATKPCARFEFPTLKGKVFSAEENTTVSLPFRLDTANCSTKTNFTVGVSKNKHLSILCQLRHLNERCKSGTPVCVCPEEDGLYRFQKTVERTDSATWNWWTSDNLTENTKLTFDVTYPASITSVSLSGKLTDPGKSVDVVCSWENGNPPVTARLLDRHGVEMASSISSGQIRYRFPAVGCQDAGLIRCEAPGASHNKTAMLLVKCPPEFAHSNVLVTGTGIELMLPVRTHTTMIEDCKLTNSQRPDAPISCIGFSTLAGTPPDLTLTVRLDNVPVNESAQWRLELTNDAGTRHVDITSGTSTRWSENVTTGESVPVIVGTLVGVIAGVIIIVIIVVNIIDWRVRRALQPPQSVEEQEMAPPPLPPPRRNPDANRQAEVARRIVYADIDDELPKGDKRLSRPLPPCSCGCVHPSRPACR